MTTVAELVEARRLRDMARGIVKTDVATVKLELAERSIPERVRDRIVLAATETAEDGVALVRENRVVVGLTVAALIGWLFRGQLGTLSARGYSLARGTIARWRA